MQFTQINDERFQKLFIFRKSFVTFTFKLFQLLNNYRGGGTWRPTVVPTGNLPSPTPKSFGGVSPVTQTSLKANSQPVQHIGSGYNSAAKPFNYVSYYKHLQSNNIIIKLK